MDMRIPPLKIKPRLNSIMSGIYGADLRDPAAAGGISKNTISIVVIICVYIYIYIERERYICVCM